MNCKKFQSRGFRLLGTHPVGADGIEPAQARRQPEQSAGSAQLLTATAGSVPNGCAPSQPKSPSRMQARERESDPHRVDVARPGKMRVERDRGGGPYRMTDESRREQGLCGDQDRPCHPDCPRGHRSHFPSRWRWAKMAGRRFPITRRSTGCAGGFYVGWRRGRARRLSARAPRPRPPSRAGLPRKAAAMASEASTITQYGRPASSSGERIHIQPPYKPAPRGQYEQEGRQRG